MSTSTHSPPSPPQFIDGIKETLTRLGFDYEASLVATHQVSGFGKRDKYIVQNIRTNLIEDPYKRCLFNNNLSLPPLKFFSRNNIILQHSFEIVYLLFTGT